MNRWNTKQLKRCENKRVDAFIDAVLAVCAEHRMSIGHEDGHGSFIVTRFDRAANAVLSMAHDGTGSSQ